MAIAHLSDADRAQLTQQLAPDVQAYVQQTGRPLNHLTRGELTRQLQKAGKLPSNYYIDTKGQVQHEESKTSMGLKAAGVFGGVGAGAALAPAAGASSYVGADVANTAASALGPTAAGAAGAAGGGTASKIGQTVLNRAGQKPQQTIPQIASLIGPLASLFGVGSNSSTSDLTKSYQGLMQGIPELRRAMALQAAQAERNDPLHRAAVQLATNLLPKSAFGAYPGRPEAAPTPGV